MRAKLVLRTSMASALHTVTVEELKRSLTAQAAVSLPAQVAGKEEGASEQWLAERLTMACDDVLQYVNAYAEIKGLDKIRPGLCAVPVELVADTLTLAVVRILEPTDGFVSELQGTALRSDYDKALADLRALRDGNGSLSWECSDDEMLEDAAASGVSVRASRTQETKWMV